MKWYLLRDRDGKPVRPAGHGWEAISTPNDLWATDNLDFVRSVAAVHADEGFTVHQLVEIKSKKVPRSAKS